MNPKISRLRAEREKNNGKIAALQTRNREIDSQIMELENTDIIGIVRESGFTPEQLSRLLQSMRQGSSSRRRLNGTKRRKNSMRKFNTRLFAGLLAVFCCMTALSATAYADGGYYEQSEDGSETPPSSIDSITISTETVRLPEQQGSEALTPDGNLTSSTTFCSPRPMPAWRKRQKTSSSSPSRAKTATTSTSSLTAPETRKTCISSTLWTRLTSWR